MTIEVKVNVGGIENYKGKLKIVGRILRSYLAWNRREMRKSITKRTSKYRKYYSYGRVHWSSAPGLPPNNDIGMLRKAIQYKMAPDGLSGSIGVWDVDYGYYLEMGTSTIAPRPFIKPQIDKTKSMLVKAIKQHMSSTSRAPISGLWSQGE